MNKIPYIENDMTEMIATIIDVEHNMELFKQKGLTDYIGSYADSCYNMCNISTFFIGTSLASYCEDGELTVHEGVFGMMGNHTWLEIEGVIIDATLCQFIPTAKPLSMIDSSYKEYNSVKRYAFNDWVERSSNVD